MEIVKGFFDYCIPDKCVTSGNFENLAKRLLELGYRTIAINQIFDESALELKKKKKKGEPRDQNDIPVPIVIKTIPGLEELKILNRLTIVFSNQDVINKIIKSPNYKKYHIIAAQPQSQQAFQFTCSSLEADILTFDPENKPDYRMNRKLYKQLIEKGVHFELLYAPVIQDSTKRKMTIFISHAYHSFGKSKNIIISSGATDLFLLRSPYDIINLGFLFGLSEEQAKSAVQHYGRNVYVQAVGRRFGKTMIIAENIIEDASQEKSQSNSEDDEEMELDQPAQKKSKQ